MHYDFRENSGARDSRRGVLTHGLAKKVGQCIGFARMVRETKNTIYIATGSPANHLTHR